MHSPDLCGFIAIPPKNCSNERGVPLSISASAAGTSVESLTAELPSCSFRTVMLDPSSQFLPFHEVPWSRLGWEVHAVGMLWKCNEVSLSAIIMIVYDVVIGQFGWHENLRRKVEVCLHKTHKMLLLLKEKRKRLRYSAFPHSLLPRPSCLPTSPGIYLPAGLLYDGEKAGTTELTSKMGQVYFYPTTWIVLQIRPPILGRKGGLGSFGKPTH